jgi:hypothetical protein
MTATLTFRCHGNHSFTGIINTNGHGLRRGKRESTIFRPLLQSPLNQLAVILHVSHQLFRSGFVEKNQEYADEN